jgi:hypothetical protein
MIWYIIYYFRIGVNITIDIFDKNGYAMHADHQMVHDTGAMMLCLCSSGAVLKL